jgi:type IV pilus assembly protein PilP
MKKIKFILLSTFTIAFMMASSAFAVNVKNVATAISSTKEAIGAANVPAQSQAKPAPAATTVPAQSQVKPVPAATTVPAQGQVKPAPAATTVPAKSQVKPVPAATTVPAQSQVKPVPAATTVPIQDKAQPASAANVTIVSTSADAYNYNPVGKPDPFRPFIVVEKVVKKIEKKEPTSIFPLQRADTDRYRVVGIAGDEDNRVAIVEDAAKKFYPLLKGTRIGLRDGKVVEIMADRVIVEEYENKKAKRVILKLRKN